MGIVVNLDSYSGPLDLLLDLITKQKINIYDIEISKITESYLNIINKSSYSEDTDISSFLVMSTTLVEIKSKTLIPKYEGDEEDDEELTRERLIEKLIEYKKFKKLAEYIKILEEEGSKFYTKMPSDVAEYDPKENEIIINTDVKVLSTLMSEIIERYERINEFNSFEKIIEKDNFPVEVYIATIKDKICSVKEAYFEDLIFNVGSKSELITIFISILELVKNNFINVFQSKDKRIKISLAGEISE